MQNSRLPQTPSQWATFLDPLTLAIGDGLRSELAGELADEDNLTPFHLAESMKREPALCLLLFHTANRMRRDGVHTLKHAINLLGTTRLARLLTGAPSRPPGLTDAAWQGYRDSLSTALFGAEIARLLNTGGEALYWAEQLNPTDIAKLTSSDAEALYWATLLREAPLWALWLQAPDLMLAWQTRRRAGEPAGRVERELFGCRLSDLCAATVAAWHLPELTIESWHPPAHLIRAIRTFRRAALDPRAGEILHTLRTPSLAAILGHELAAASQLDWFSPQTRRLAQATSGWLKQDPDTGLAHLHRWAAICSREHLVDGALPPACALLSASVPLSPPPGKSTTVSPAHTAQAHPATTPTGDATQAAFAALLQRLAEEPFDSMPDMLRHATEALPAALEVPAVVVMLFNRERTELRSYFHAGKPPAALLGYRHTLTQSDLFRRLSEQQAGVQIRAANRQQFHRLLPESFQIAAGLGECMLLSVFASGKPLAVIYAGAGTRSTYSLPETSYPRLKQVGQALSQALQRLTERRRQAAQQ